MSYQADTLVLHLNNVANVAGYLVETARKQGKTWALREIPHPQAGRLLRSVWDRAVDWADFWRLRPRTDLLHIHYGPNGYYGLDPRPSACPYVLHLHGSDLRKDALHPVLGNLQRISAQRAAALVYSTPDLAELATQLRSDARYLPNPLPPQLGGDFLDAAEQTGQPEDWAESGGAAGTAATSAGFTRTRGRAEPENRVFCNCRLDDTKGGLKLIAQLGELVKAGIAVYGLDWGIYASAAAQAGVKLLPLMSNQQFLVELSRSRLVVGQQSIGSLGMSDLQTMAIGRPLVVYTTDKDVPVLHSTLDTLAEVVLDAWRDLEALYPQAQAGQAWVRENHHPARVLAKLEELYAQILP